MWLRRAGEQTNERAPLSVAAKKTKGVRLFLDMELLPPPSLPPGVGVTVRARVNADINGSVAPFIFCLLSQCRLYRAFKRRT
jgi:hypothetical protein